MTANAQELRRRLLDLGATRLFLRTAWFNDQYHWDLRAERDDRSEVQLPNEVFNVHYDDLTALLDNRADGRNGAYLWDVERDVWHTAGDVIFFDSEAYGFVDVRTSDPEALLRIGAFPSEPEAFDVERFARHDDAFVRLAIAEHPLTPTYVLEWLAGDVELKVERAARARLTRTAALDLELLSASHPHTLPRDLAVLARSDFDRVRLAVALNPSASVATLTELASDARWHVSLAVATNPACPEAVYHALVTRWGRVSSAEQIVAVVQWPHVPRALLEQWADHPNPEVRVAVAQHPAVPEEALRRAIGNTQDADSGLPERARTLARSLLEDIRAAAKNRLPIEMQWRFATSEYEELRYAIATNPHTASEVLTFLLDDHHVAFVARRRLAEREDSK